MVRLKLLLTIVLAAVGTFWLSGCAPREEKSQAADATIENTIPAEFVQKYWNGQEVPVSHIIRRNYRLREGDSLEVIYHVRYQENPDYKIKIQDVVTVTFPYEARLNQTEQVHSDGNLYLSLIGPVKAHNKTAPALQKELEQKYGQYLNKPILTVSFKESNVKIRELKQAITTSPRGQSRLVPITPDGTISVPFIINTRAAGKTIDELHEDLNDAYESLGLDELEVTVNVQEVAPLRVFVFGEVTRPGAILNMPGASSSGNEMTLLQALAQAGSYLPGRAELSTVMLVRRRHLPRPQIALINVFQLLENQKHQIGKPVVADSSQYRYDIWLEDGDIVYVPTTEVAKRGDFIEQFWTRGVRPIFDQSVDYSAGDAVDWLGPNP